MKLDQLERRVQMAYKGQLVIRGETAMMEQLVNRDWLDLELSLWSRII